ncbi:NUDIX domain-containing protein [Alphaproteobacteria bacterium GH1-50]|uniref:NUDIX domain-containing protein n=1 Tax=Kangsaoukella pontilimi TaxID=2691042 RepID=A0A7C9IM24_9RHOB|nr:NUDIX hydrolase [Kangsaoukella pontilimi]MXQ06410.1 NUDIX domain-containing protein [Kangsaoukella pontilimi]
MSVGKIKQRPLKLGGDDKRNVRTQFGAVCWRQHRDEVQVLLVTSKRSKRWIIPKGWPQDGATPAEAAMTEAWEEGGVEGKVRPVCLGIYSYSKERSDNENMPCVVAIFPIKVANLAKSWPEERRRKRRWFSLKKAAGLVEEPELSSILRKFDPSAF